MKFMGIGGKVKIKIMRWEIIEMVVWGDYERINKVFEEEDE